MANEYGLDIVRVMACVPVDVVRRIDRMAAEAGKTRSQFVAEVLAAKVVGVSLSSEDREWIVEYIERAKARRKEKRRGN
jgi:hypothetical protein